MAFFDIAPHSPEWHATRLKHIGGSEVAALFGAQAAYAQRLYELHHVKAGKVPPRPVDNERVRMGLALEPAIAKMAAAEEGWTIVPGRYAEDDACPGLGSSLDFEITHPSEAALKALPGIEGPGCLETKNTDYLVWKNTWTENEPPIYQLMQLQAQLACSGYEWGCLAALIGGNTLRKVYYRRRERSIAGIRQRVDAFWADVRAGKAPKPDDSEGAGHVIRHLFPDLAYDPIDLRSNNRAPELCADYDRGAAMEKEGKALKDSAKHQLMELMGSSRKGLVQGYNLTIAVTAATEPRPAPPGHILSGRAESRRLIVSELAVVAA